MTDAPVLDHRTMTAVETVCFWIRRDLSIANPGHLELMMIIENGWLRKHHSDRDIHHIEAACRRFLSHRNSHPNLEVHP